MPPDMFDQPTNLKMVELDVEAARLHLSMPGEDRAVVELLAPSQSAEELRAGRPIVYLDQTWRSWLNPIKSCCQCPQRTWSRPRRSMALPVSP